MKKIFEWLKALSDPIETFKNLFEIVAIILAGCWTIYFYKTTEGPSLEKALSIEGTVSIDSINEEQCMLVDMVSLKNLSKSCLDIDYVVSKYWLIPLDTILGYREFNVSWCMEHFAVTDSEVNPEIGGHFTPKASGYEGSNFIVPNNPNTVLICQSIAFWHKKHFWGKNDTFQQDSYDVRIRCIPDKIKKEGVKQKDENAD
jgi:hypothetical protein